MRLSICCALAAFLLLSSPGVLGDLSDKPQRERDFNGLFRMGSVWSFLAVFEFDERIVRPAVIDIGMRHEETRPPGNACQIPFVPGTAASVLCSSQLGDYNGFMNHLDDDPTDSPYRNHGNRMKNLIAATINDSGEAGIAGQVAIPNLYQFTEVTGFLFELDTAINRAVADDSTVVSISAGIPCKLLWDGTFTGNVCTPQGRAEYCLASLAHTASDLLMPGQSAVDYLNALAPVLKGALCGATAAATLAEGNLISRMSAAINHARLQGVPVVASAGNLWDAVAIGQESLSLTPMASANADSWGIVPATLEHVIGVGAVYTDADHPGYPNSDFHGDSVDIWAPSNDTSPAAAYVSGVISLAQAVNPALDPNNTGLSSAARKAIVPNIRALLIDTAYDTSHPLVANDSYRKRLINPYGVIKMAASAVLPPLSEHGYASITDDLLSPNRELYADDDPFWTIQMNHNRLQRAGTIVYLPGPKPYVDADPFHLRYPAESGPYEATVDLIFPERVGELQLQAQGSVLELLETKDVGFQRRLRYRIKPQPAGSKITVYVLGKTPQDDNVYVLAAMVRNLDDGPIQVKPQTERDAQSAARFVDRMESAFQGIGPPELGCVSCNTLAANGSIPLSSSPHAIAGKRALPGNTRAVRFVEVTKAGSYSVSLETRSARGVSALSMVLLDERGRVVSRSGKTVLTANLAAGRYLLAVGGNVSGRRAAALRYRFQPAAQSRARR